METRAPYVLIGAFVLLGMAGLVLFGLWSARYQSESVWSEYEIVFEQAVSGLSIGSSVQYNGISMGSVRELYLEPEDPSQVVAVIRLDAEAPVREDTVARLSISGLTGVAFIQLRGGSAESPVLTAPEPGQRPRILAEPSPLQRLIDASDDIASTASQVLLRMLDILSEENAVRVSTTLDNIDAFTRALAGEENRIAETLANAQASSEALLELLENANRTIGEVGEAVAGIEQHLIDELPNFSADLSETLAQFASLSRRLDRVIADNEQALSEFGAEGLAQFGPALQEFRLLLRELSRLSGRFERHPAGFLLGADQPEEYQPE
ncbi:MlaD family protein [Wenzhouxiangella marina]|uniref:Mammalian cell entry related domain protein n=1 Tax=Wenzhouxiangella marina TaxID=1579979 RepID=A0A0K0XYU3_9GAMM|nr:MlaD family protein [Wenzhouxiangella marina]AKS42864.1 Mammalian cell entry related domain protein [Wenzhouxiangella marina]MBB6087454.1 phospholipid/cholesterol/gamma-HCH transport system substrate-binding protein [Wenzhouxiangella marina]